jgi:hypothetical protein
MLGKHGVIARPRAVLQPPVAVREILHSAAIT